jgi:uncharacterized membrane protein YgcG
MYYTNIKAARICYYLTMRAVVVVNKDGTLRQQLTRMTRAADLYKTIGLKASPDFGEQARWPVPASVALAAPGTACDVRMFGKTTGHSRFANVYGFPPPINQTVFIGTCVAALFCDDEMSNLSVDQWDSVVTAGGPGGGGGGGSGGGGGGGGGAPILAAAAAAAIIAVSAPPPPAASAAIGGDTYMDCTYELSAEPYLTR